MAEPRPDHAGHDRLLIAALAAGDLRDTEQVRAELLVARCAACAELASDLRAIAQATNAAAMPVPDRPRSFTLGPADAARLRPTGWRAFVRRFASPDWSFTRPLAAGLTTLGLAGLLVSAMPGLPGLGGSAASPAASLAAAPAQERDVYSEDHQLTGAPSGAPAASPGAQAPPSAAPVPVASPSGFIPPDDTVSVHGQGASPGASPQPSDPAGRLEPTPESSLTQRAAEEAAADAATRDAPSSLAILGGTSLLIGLGLFGLRWAGRRLD